MFLDLMKVEQRTFVYVCVGRMCGFHLEAGFPWGQKVDKTAPPIFQPRPPEKDLDEESRLLHGNLLGSLRSEARIDDLYGQAATIKSTLFGKDENEDKPLYRVTRYIITASENGADGEGTRQGRIEDAKEIFNTDLENARRVLFELVDTALTILLNKSSRPPKDLTSQANETLEKGRQENDDINFVLGFAEEALLPSSMKVGDFVAASATLIDASLQVADFVNTGEAPLKSKEKEGDGHAGEPQDQAGDETAEGGNGWQDDTASGLESS